MPLVVTGGKWKGRRLGMLPAGGPARPTSGRVREALFSILGGRVVDSRFLDLYAGYGSVGFEAASRGAVEVCLVEKSARTFRQLARNCKALGDSNVRLRRMDAMAFCGGAAGGNRWDVAFADPPFQSDFTRLPDVLEPLVAAGGAVIIQYPSRRPPTWLSRAQAVRQYGESGLAIFYY